MAIEHWGTLSVKDHLDKQALIADLLLYDRLVFPVFSGDGERTRWREQGWDPEDQESVIEDLGADLAVKAQWNNYLQDQYRDLRKARQQIAAEASEAYQMTRMVLAMDAQRVTPPNTEVRAIAAYHDAEEGRSQLGLTRAQPDEIALGKLGFVIGQELLIPLVAGKADCRETMLRARDLSLKPLYRAQRTDFYKWQEDTVDAIARGRKTVNSAVNELQQDKTGLKGSIHRYVVRHKKELVTNAVLTVIGIGIPIALGEPHAAGLLGFVPGGFEVVKFGAGEFLGAIDQPRSEAAAMFVTAKKALR